MGFTKTQRGAAQPLLHLHTHTQQPNRCSTYTHTHTHTQQPNRCSIYTHTQQPNRCSTQSDVSDLWSWLPGGLVYGPGLPGGLVYDPGRLEGQRHGAVERPLEVWSMSCRAAPGGLVYELQSGLWKSGL